MIDSLQTKFGIPGAVAVSPGQNNMPRVTLSHRSGASAEIYLHGAHVTSWRDAKGEELLFLSRASNWAADKPIRGGVPICFPQFSNHGPLPLHGFARVSEWTLAQTERLGSGEVVAALQLSDSDATQALWPHRFTIELRVTLAEAALTLAVQVKNHGDKPFDFELALHTYFGGGEIQRTAVCGLEGVTFSDSLRNNVQEVESRKEIRFDQETDRIYINTPDCVRIRDEARSRVIAIQKSGMADAVVWNPWIAKSQRMADFGDDEYLRMVCVETGNMASRVNLAPHGQWHGSTVLSVLPA
ncbi:MAG: D-hexose-6-phosphate mutarotase [Verrucomicrobia bacterium]|nr:D-hexose-6-phosphate mutarotase [Verrucomicrobiota bacterium]